MKEEKQHFIENFIGSKIVDTTNDRESEKKSFRHHFYPMNKESRRTVYGLLKHSSKISAFRSNPQAVYELILGFLPEVVSSFNPENFDWSKLNELGSNENKQLHKYVFIGVRNKIDHYTTFLDGKKKMQIDGEKKFVELDMSPYSIDCEIDDGESGSYKLTDSLTTKDSIFPYSMGQEEDDAEQVHFLKWFEANKGEVEMIDGEYQVVKKGFLTKTQLIFLASVGKNYDRKKSSYFRKMIRQRTFQAFKNQFDIELDKGRYFSVTQAISYFNQLINTVERSDKQGEALSNWLVSNSHLYSFKSFLSDYLNKYMYDINNVLYMQGKSKLDDDTAKQIADYSNSRLVELYNRKMFEGISDEMNVEDHLEDSNLIRLNAYGQFN